MNLNFEKMGGLVPVVVQDSETFQVLMLGFMNKEALDITLSDKKVTFFSRTKGRIWQKGESSGNFLNLISISADCDNDSLLIMARPEGATCHKGEISCFGKGKFDLLKLFKLIKKRKSEMPEGSYTASLFSDGLEQILAKVEEESEEVCRAARSEGKQRLVEESCDLMYHLFVLLVNEGIGIEEIFEELGGRMG